VVVLGWQTAAHEPPLELPLELVVVPPPSPEDDPPVLPPLEQAASPAVAEAPATTRTWNSFDTSMVLGIVLRRVGRVNLPVRHVDHPVPGAERPVTPPGT
jgi:hypothetical protein